MSDRRSQEWVCSFPRFAASAHLNGIAADRQNFWRALATTHARGVTLVRQFDATTTRKPLSLLSLLRLLSLRAEAFNDPSLQPRLACANPRCR